MVWTFASAAKRASPPGTSDCSGYQYVTVPALLTVLIAESALGPPMASAALLTRLCSLVAVAQESRKHAPVSAARVYLMVFLLGMGRRENTTPKELFPRTIAVGGTALPPAPGYSCRPTGSVDPTPLIWVNSSGLMRPSPSRSTPSQLEARASSLVSSVPVR